MRHQIRAELAAITPLDDLEREHLADAAAWIDSGAELCRTAKPATPPKHLVSYFVVASDTQVLLVDHKNAQLWLPPGGHVEPGEHPRDTVRREAREELGWAPAQHIDAPLMVTVTTTVGRTAGHTDVSLWYVLRGDPAQPVDHDRDEFHAVRWFLFSEVPLARSDPHMARFLHKLAGSSGARQPGRPPLA
jgi:ADP-ribose pyrophosphatase YjhB (NUDIX family)